MSNEKISADDALDLARQFRLAATAVGDYCYENWAGIQPKERDQLRSLEVTLLNLATDLITQSVGIVLDGAQASLADLTDVTKKARTALKKIDGARKAITVVSALIALAAAIPTGNAGTIVSAVQALREAATGKPPDANGAAAG